MTNLPDPTGAPDMNEASDQPDAPRDYAIRPATIVDRLDTVNGTVVLVETDDDHQVIRLSPLGAAVLDALDEAGGWADLGTLTSALVVRLGAPVGVDPQDAVRDLVDALVGVRVVVAEL